MYIAQYGPGTASLNVAVACSIVLHRFAVWAGYEERQREGEKFVVADRPKRDAARGEGSGGKEQGEARRGSCALRARVRAGTVPLTEAQRAELARARRERADDDDEDAVGRMSELLA